MPLEDGWIDRLKVLYQAYIKYTNDIRTSSIETALSRKGDVLMPEKTWVPWIPTSDFRFAAYIDVSMAA